MEEVDPVVVAAAAVVVVVVIGVRDGWITIMIMKLQG
jgi:hypothetical protein